MPAGSSPFVGSSSTSSSGSGYSAAAMPSRCFIPINRPWPCHPASRAARPGCGDCLDRSRSPPTPALDQRAHPAGESLRMLDRLAQNRPRSAARLDQTQEDADRRRLPRSIRTHEPDHNTVGNLEREVVHRNEIPEAPGQPICGQCAHGCVWAVDVCRIWMAASFDQSAERRAGRADPSSRSPCDLTAALRNRQKRMTTGHTVRSDCSGHRLRRRDLLPVVGHDPGHQRHRNGSLAQAAVRRDLAQPRQPRRVPPPA